MKTSYFKWTEKKPEENSNLHNFFECLHLPCCQQTVESHHIKFFLSCTNSSFQKRIPYFSEIFKNSVNLKFSKRVWLSIHNALIHSVFSFWGQDNFSRLQCLHRLTRFHSRTKKNIFNFNSKFKSIDWITSCSYEASQSTSFAAMNDWN